MAEDLGWEIRLYKKSYVTDWVLSDILPEYKSLQFTKVLNDAGAGSITFDWKSLNNSNRYEVTKDCLFAFCKPSKNITQLSPAQGVDIVFGIIPEVISHDYAYPNKHEVTFSGPGGAELLNRSIVLPAGYPTINPDERSFFAARALDAWEDMRAEAHTRGASASFIQPWGAGSIKNVDSSNLSWSPAIDINATVKIRSGMGLLDLLKWAQSFGGFNFHVDYARGGAGGILETAMRVFVYQNPRVDVSNQVALYLGRHHLGGNRTIVRESIMSNLYGGINTNSARTTLENTFVRDNFGKREFYWTDATNYDLFIGATLGQKILNSKSAEQNTMTLEIAPNVDHRAFVDYDIFDLITYDNSELGVRGQYLVMGLAVRVQDQQETQEILLETPIQTFNRRIYEDMNRDEQKFKYNSRIVR